MSTGLRDLWICLHHDAEKLFVNFALSPNLSLQQTLARLLGDKAKGTLPSFEELIPTLVDNNLVQRLISMSLSRFLCHVSVRVTCPRDLSRSLWRVARKIKAWSRRKEWTLCLRCQVRGETDAIMSQSWRVTPRQHWVPSRFATPLLTVRDWLTILRRSLRRAAPVRGCVGMCHKSVLRAERELGPLRTILNPSANMFVQCTAATLHSAAFPILTLASLKVTRDTHYCWHLLPSVSQVWQSQAMNLLRMNSRCPMSIVHKLVLWIVLGMGWAFKSHKKLVITASLSAVLSHHIPFAISINSINSLSVWNFILSNNELNW